MRQEKHYAESHATFYSGICMACADLGRRQGKHQERQRIYAWLSVILPTETLQTTGDLLREALHGSSEYPPGPAAE